MSQPPAGSSSFVPYTTKFAYANKSTQYSKPFYAKVIEQKNTENQAKFDTWKALPDGDAKYQQGVELGYINKVDYDNYVTQKTAIDTWNALPNNDKKYKAGVDAGYIDRADYDSYITKKNEIDNWNAMPDGLDKAKAGLAKGYITVSDYNSYTSAIEQNKARMSDFSTWKNQPTTVSSIEEGFNKGFYDYATRNEYLNNLKEFEAWKASPDSWEKSRIAVDKGYMTFPEAGEYYNIVLHNQQVDKYNSLKDDPVAQLTYGVNIGLITNEQYKTDLAKVENTITFNGLPANTESQIIYKLRYARDNGIEVTLSNDKTLKTREQFAEYINSINTKTTPSPVEWVANPLATDGSTDFYTKEISPAQDKSGGVLVDSSGKPLGTGTPQTVLIDNGIWTSATKASPELAELMARGLIKQSGGQIKIGSVRGEDGTRYIITKRELLKDESEALARAGFKVTDIPVVSGTSGWSKQLYDLGKSIGTKPDFAVALDATNLGVFLNPIEDAITYGKSLIFNEEYLPTQKISADTIANYVSLTPNELLAIQASNFVTEQVGVFVATTGALTAAKTLFDVGKIVGTGVKLSKSGGIIFETVGKAFTPLTDIIKAINSTALITKTNLATGEKAIVTINDIASGIVKGAIKSLPYGFAALQGGVEGVKVAQLQLAGVPYDQIAGTVIKDTVSLLVIGEAFKRSSSLIKTINRNVEPMTLYDVETGKLGKSFRITEGSYLDVGGKPVFNINAKRRYLEPIFDTIDDVVSPTQYSNIKGPTDLAKYGIEYIPSTTQLTKGINPATASKTSNDIITAFNKTKLGNADDFAVQFIPKRTAITNIVKPTITPQEGDMLFIKTPTPSALSNIKTPSTTTIPTVKTPKITAEMKKEIIAFRNAYGESSLFPEIGGAIMDKLSNKIALTVADKTILAQLSEGDLPKLKNIGIDKFPQFKGSKLEKFSIKLDKMVFTANDPVERKLLTTITGTTETGNVAIDPTTGKLIKVTISDAVKKIKYGKKGLYVDETGINKSLDGQKPNVTLTESKEILKTFGDKEVSEVTTKTKEIFDKYSSLGGKPVTDKIVPLSLRAEKEADMLVSKYKAIVPEIEKIMAKVKKGEILSTEDLEVIHQIELIDPKQLRGTGIRKNKPFTYEGSEIERNQKLRNFRKSEPVSKYGIHDYLTAYDENGKLIFEPDTGAVHVATINKAGLKIKPIKDVSYKTEESTTLKAKDEGKQFIEVYGKKYPKIIPILEDFMKGGVLTKADKLYLEKVSKYGLSQQKKIDFLKTEIKSIIQVHPEYKVVIDKYTNSLELTSAEKKILKEIPQSGKNILKKLRSQNQLKGIELVNKNPQYSDSEIKRLQKLREIALKNIKTPTYPKEPKGRDIRDVLVKWDETGKPIIDPKTGLPESTFIQEKIPALKFPKKGIYFDDRAVATPLGVVNDKLRTTMVTRKEATAFLKAYGKKYPELKAIIRNFLQDGILTDDNVKLLKEVSAYGLDQKYITGEKYPQFKGSDIERLQKLRKPEEIIIKPEILKGKYAHLDTAPKDIRTTALSMEEIYQIKDNYKVGSRIEKVLNKFISGKTLTFKEENIFKKLSERTPKQLEKTGIVEITSVEYTGLPSKLGGIGVGWGVNSAKSLEAFGKTHPEVSPIIKKIWKGEKITVANMNKLSKLNKTELDKLSNMGVKIKYKTFYKYEGSEIERIQKLRKITKKEKIYIPEVVGDPVERATKDIIKTWVDTGKPITDPITNSGVDVFIGDKIKSNIKFPIAEMTESGMVKIAKDVSFKTPDIEKKRDLSAKWGAKREAKLFKQQFGKRYKGVNDAINKFLKGEVLTIAEENVLKNASNEALNQLKKTGLATGKLATYEGSQIEFLQNLRKADAKVPIIVVKGDLIDRTVKDIITKSDELGKPQFDPITGEPVDVFLNEKLLTSKPNKGVVFEDEKGNLLIDPITGDVKAIKTNKSGFVVPPSETKPLELSKGALNEIKKLREIYIKTGKFMELEPIIKKIEEHKTLSPEDKKILSKLNDYHALQLVGKGVYPKYNGSALDKFVKEMDVRSVPEVEGVHRPVKATMLAVDPITGEYIIDPITGQPKIITDIEQLKKIKGALPFDIADYGLKGKWVEPITNVDTTLKVDGTVLKSAEAVLENLDISLIDMDTAPEDVKHIISKLKEGKFIGVDERSILEEAMPFNIEKFKASNKEAKEIVEIAEEYDAILKQKKKIDEAEAEQAKKLAAVRKPKEVRTVKSVLGEEKSGEGGTEVMTRDGQVLVMTPEQAKEAKALEKTKEELDKIDAALKLLKKKGMTDEEAVEAVTSLVEPNAKQTIQMMEKLKGQQKQAYLMLTDVLGGGLGAPRSGSSLSQTSATLSLMVNPTPQKIRDAIPMMESGVLSVILPKLDAGMISETIQKSTLKERSEIIPKIFENIIGKPEIISRIFLNMDTKTLQNILPLLDTKQINRLTFKQISDIFSKLKSAQDTQSIQAVMQKLNGKMKGLFYPLYGGLEISDDKYKKEKPSKQALLYKVLFFYKDKSKTVEKKIYARTFSEALNKTWFERGSNVIPKRVKVIFLGKEEVKK